MSKIFDAWWFQTTHLRLCSKEEEKAREVWNASKANAIIILRLSALKYTGAKRAIIADCAEELERELTA